MILVRLNRIPTTVLVFCLFTSIYLLSGKGRIVSSDAWSMLEVTKSIVEGHTVSISPHAPSAVIGKDDRHYSIYGIGKSLANIPFFIAGKTIAKFYPRYPEDFFYMFTVSLLNPFLTAGTCTLLFGLCIRLGFNEREAVLLATSYGLCTIAFPYAKDDMSEPLATVLVLSSVYSAYRYSRYSRLTCLPWLVVSATSLGGAVATRYVLALLTLPIGAYLVSVVTSRPATSVRKRVGHIAVFALILFIFAVLLGYYNYVRFGTAFETGYRLFGFGPSGLFDLRPTHVLSAGLGLLVSPGRGLFLYMPFLVLAFAGVPTFFRTYPRDAILLGGSFALYLLVVSGYKAWEGGWSWGPRLLIPLLPLLILFVGFAFRLSFFRRPLGRIIALGLACISFLIQLSAVIVPWERYMQVVGADVEARSLDIIWTPHHAQPLKQWQQIAEVFSMTEKEQQAPPYPTLNSPDLWFLHLSAKGVPRLLILVPLLTLLCVGSVSIAVLCRRLREVS